MEKKELIKKLAQLETINDQLVAELEYLDILTKQLGFEKKGIQANPEFVDIDNGNYTLKANSPAIDAGLNPGNSEQMKDINSVSRPQGKAIDIGAYEFIPK